VKWWIPVLAAAATAALAAGPLMAQQPDGRAIYREECRNCHGANGVPPAAKREEYPRIPTFADSSFFDHRSQDSIVAVLRHGAGRDMKSFRDKLSPAEIDAVAAFIRTLQRRRG